MDESVRTVVVAQKTRRGQRQELRLLEDAR